MSFSPPLLFALYPPHCPTTQGESVSSETSNGYIHEAEGTWQAFDEEADTQSTQSTHMDVTTDPQSQGSLLLSHSEALAGTRTYREVHLEAKESVDVFIFRWISGKVL